MSASQATSQLASTPASSLTARIAAEFAIAHAGAAHGGGVRTAAAGEPVRGDAGRQGGDAQAAHALATRPEAALQALMDGGLPTSRDENWKYVNLRPLEKVRFAPPSSAVRPAMTAADLPAAVGKSRYVFVDGVLEPSLSTTTAVPGVTVTSARGSGAVAAQNAAASGTGNGAAAGGAVAARGVAAGTATGDAAGVVSAANGTAAPGDLRFALLNEAFATDGAQIHVARGTDCAICVELVFVATAEAKAGASYPRVSFKVDANARVGLIERHISFGNDANFINCAVDVEVARDASVQHYRVQQTGARAIWFDTLTAKLAENAKYQVHTVNLGALSARSTVYVKLLGERSEVGVFGASVGGKNQVHDTFALVDHIAPNARTEQSFRGIAGGRARVAFNGKIVVRKGAHGTDSSQSLRGLLAGTDAEIDVRPQLEIYTDDVRCNHGATAGKLDDNMLFYLLSRGLDRETALRLLKWAFLEDVVSKIEVPELRHQIEESLAGRLEAPLPMENL
ncbi:MAG: Fe-S cluster assembly protein SufD [Proteobacteria bacterium]|nr:Fe-S cluster assembly protein SufD [Pseudomonadota bacterium]